MARARELNDDFDDADTVVLPHVGPGPQTGSPIALAALDAPAVDGLEALTDEDPSTAELHACYDEYLRMLDELPVLYDVVSEPPRVRIRDFVRCERPDARKHRREDPYVLRQRLADELEERYREYEAVLAGKAPAAAPARRAKAAKKKAVTAGNKPRRRGKRRKR